MYWVVHWCSKNNLELNLSKMDRDYRRITPSCLSSHPYTNKSAEDDFRVQRTALSLLVHRKAQPKPYSMQEIKNNTPLELLAVFVTTVIKSELC